MSGSLLALATLVDTLETPIRSEASALRWLRSEQRRMIRASNRIAILYHNRSLAESRRFLNPGIHAGSLD